MNFLWEHVVQLRISSEFYTLIGVLLGYLLSEITRVIRESHDLKKKKQALRNELETILSQLPQKIDIISQMKTGLKLEKSLPGKSVHILTLTYYKNMHTLLGCLSQKEINCLHVIYERLRVGEEFMDNLEDKVRSEFKANESKSHKLVSPLKYYQIRIEEIEASYKLCIKLIQSYLDNNPVDVFYIEKGRK